MISLTHEMTREANHAELEPLAHYAQKTLQHRQVIAVLEATEAEKREAIRDAEAANRRNPFRLVLGRKADKSLRSLETDLEFLLLRVAEERRSIVDGDHQVHSILHVWLSAHDPEYRKASEIEKRFSALHSDIEPLVSALVDLLSRFGATRNEIAVSYDGRSGLLSMVSLGALDRLIHSYEILIEAQKAFGLKLVELNDLVDGPIFSRLKLEMFNQLIPPDCRRGMDYATLRANLDEGAAKVKEAIRLLQNHVGRIETLPGEMNTLLFEYREALWRRYIGALEGADEAESPLEFPADCAACPGGVCAA